MTALQQIQAGSRVTAAQLQDVAPLAAYKGSNQSVTSSTTLVNDSALSIALQADSVYYFELVIGYVGANSGSGDIKVGWSLPSGATIAYAAYGNVGGSATDAPWVTATTAQVYNTLGTSTPVALVLQGTIATGSSGGTAQVQWAQNHSSSTATTVYAGSVLTAWQVQ